MILIADSGSTKTDWCLAEKGVEIQRIKTKGINPYFQTSEDINNVINTSLLPLISTKKIDGVYFYGAGCTEDKHPLMMEIIKNNFINTPVIEVCSDMLAAARSLCNSQKGIACILGTGSNSCYYDGTKITDNVSPLGFILGDEGSGATLGKILIGDILKNQMPCEIKEKFMNKYKCNASQIIDRVYRQPFPNRYLASFAPFLSENRDNPSIRQLILNNFVSFLRRNVMQYDYRNNKVHFIGSVAFNLMDILKEACEIGGITYGRITQSPMEGLIEYHKN